MLIIPAILELHIKKVTFFFKSTSCELMHTDRVGKCPSRCGAKYVTLSKILNPQIVSKKCEIYEYTEKLIQLHAQRHSIMRGHAVALPGRDGITFSACSYTNSRDMQFIQHLLYTEHYASQETLHVL